jgi:hypothetical protein
MLNGAVVGLTNTAMSKPEPGRWESGSDFHFCENTALLADPASTGPIADPQLAFFISGRTALTALVRLGMQQHGWTRIYFPSYYCHNVIEYVRQTGIETCYYPYNPFTAGNDVALQVPDQVGSAVICVNYFGAFRTTPNRFDKTMVIEDVTHDILSYQTSVADYCFGSLRKELPVPVGGFCAASSDTAPASAHWPPGESLAATKLSAMYLKSRYLKGQADKDIYRKLFAEGEAMLAHCPHDAAMPLLARAVLSSLNTGAIGAARQDNLSRATQMLDLENLGHHGVRIFAEGLGLTLLCSHQEQRDLLRNSLLSQSIFPAILWPGQMREQDKVIEGRILFVHLDYRYGLRDVEKIIHCINNFFAA